MPANLLASRQPKRRISSEALSLSGQGELQRQLYQGIRQLILAGTWHSGALLPSERQLAQDLKLSRSTVQQGLQQLVAEGYLQAQQGRGYQIVANLPDQFFHAAATATLNQSTLPFNHYGLTCKQGKSHGRLQPGITDYRQFPWRLWQQLLQQHSSRKALQGMAEPLGYLPLRQALVQYLRQYRQLKCTEQHILITSGAQQALFIAAKLVARAGEPVLMESPGYPRLKQALQLAELEVNYVPAAGPEGLDLTQLPVAADAKALFLTPSHQYPGGGIMPLNQRLALLNWAQQNRCWLIEDDYDSEFQYQHRPVASLQGLANGQGVIFAGSFSKTLFPALRLGYLVAEPQLIASASAIQQALHGDVPLLPQAALTDFITEGHFNRHLRKMRRHYQQQKAMAIALLQQQLPDCRILATQAGLHLTLLIPRLTDDLALSQLLQQQGFKVQPFSRYCFLNEPERGLVIGIADADHATIMQLIAVLKNL